MTTFLKHFSLSILLARLAAMAGASDARAQSDSASLSVRVTDESGAAVPGASVVARHQATQGTREATSDATGTAVFTLLPPGSYETTVTLPGFKQYRDTGVRLQVAQAARLEVRLGVGAVNTDPDYNSLSYSPSIDAIAEFQVQTAQFSAEFGRAGGQVNVVTKSGASRLGGSLFEYHRDDPFHSIWSVSCPPSSATTSVAPWADPCSRTAFSSSAPTNNCDAAKAPRR